MRKIQQFQTNKSSLVERPVSPFHGEPIQDGVIDSQKAIAVSGHDFGSMGLCTVISHRIYSLKYDGGFMHLKNQSRGQRTGL
jgi:hypothetical protein